VWLVALAVTAAVTTLWDMGWRRVGMQPSVANGVERWVTMRRRVRPSSTVLVGTSRIQAGVDPQVWARVAGGPPPIQLALIGATPVPVLEDLSLDTGFVGLVVVDVIPFFAYDLDRLARREEHTRTSIETWRRGYAGPSAVTESWLRAWVGGWLVTGSPETSPRTLIERATAGHVTGIPAFTMRRDRFLRFAADRARVTNLDRLESAWGTPARGPAFERILSRIANSVARITGRGGTVVFLRMPSCGRRKAIEDRYYPPAVYWDPVIERTGAPFVDSDRYPELSGFPCHDGSHLDATEAPVFTEALVPIVLAAVDSISTGVPSAP